MSNLTESEKRKMGANADIAVESLMHGDIAETKAAVGRICISLHKILSIKTKEGLAVIREFELPVFDGSAIVLVREEEFANVKAALDKGQCEYDVLPPIDYDLAFKKFDAAVTEQEEKYIAIKNFNYDDWNDGVAKILDKDKSENTMNSLLVKVEEFYDLIFKVTGEKLAWGRDQQDTVFLCSKSYRRKIIDLAFSPLVPLVHKHVMALRLGNERVNELLKLLSKILGEGISSSSREELPLSSEKKGV